MSNTTASPVTLSKLVSRQKVAERTMAFRFERLSDWKFKAGQFLEMTLLNPSETDAEGNAARALPSASVSEGLSKVISRNWPALNFQSESLSKRNAMVRSATFCRLTSLDRVTGEAVVLLMSSPY